MLKGWVRAAIEERLDQFLWHVARKAPFGSRVINGDDGSPYLLRVYLTPRSEDAERRYQRLPGVFLHYFFRGDEDRELHNHPWGRSMSLILVGGYVEERLDRLKDRVLSKRFRPGRLNFLDSNDFHRVDLLQPGSGCWSLFIAGEKVQNWGFLDPKTREFIFWQERDHRRMVKTGNGPSGARVASATRS